VLVQVALAVVEQVQRKVSQETMQALQIEALAVVVQVAT
jgi:hypothetical protein